MKLPEMLGDRIGVLGAGGNQGRNRDGRNVDTLLFQVIKETMHSNPRAKLALDYFVYRIALFTGMLAAAMGGINGFVFTAGIGENAPAIREAVVQRLSWLGLELDTAAKREGRKPDFAPRIARCLLHHSHR
jgi:acetate kinase